MGVLSGEAVTAVEGSERGERKHFLPQLVWQVPHFLSQLTDRMGAKPSYSLSLEEEDSPVSRPEVEDIGSLVVVRCLSGQGVMDANGVLQVILCQGLARLVLLLKCKQTVCVQD